MAKGLYKLRSPAKFWQMAAISAGVSLWGGMQANKRAKAEQRRAKEAMAKTKAAYLDLDTSNPYAGMENTYEDLTINQRQAQFEAQQGQQQRADVMESLRGAAGGSGIAGLAQAMANQGVQQTARASASIGMQESRNQYAAAQGGMRVQEKKAYGETLSRSWKRDTAGTLFGMDMQAVTAANAQRAAARQQMNQAIGQGIGALGQGAMQGAFSKTGAPPITSTATPQLQLGTTQGLNYVPPQTNTFPIGQSQFGGGFGQQQGANPPWTPNQNFMSGGNPWGQNQQQGQFGLGQYQLPQYDINGRRIR